MKAARKRPEGMTLVEMLAAISVLMILMLILAQVFSSAGRAASRGKAVAEVYQVARAVTALVSRDLAGATPDFLTSQENGYHSPTVRDLPPGPYHTALSYAPAGPILPGTAKEALMRRMLMGGSDYVALSSSSASPSDKAVCKVFYVLRATGELVRIVHEDTEFTDMDYSADAQVRLVDTADPVAMANYEDAHVVAENVERIKFSFLDKGTGGISDLGRNYAAGTWVDNWDWDDPTSGKRYLPSAVKVQVQLVDSRWTTANDNRISNRGYNSSQLYDKLVSSEMFDPDDGEGFSFIVDMPLGARGAGG